MVTERIIVQMKLLPNYLDTIKKEAQVQKKSPAEIIEGAIHEIYLASYPDIASVMSLQDVTDGKRVYRINDEKDFKRVRSRLYQQAYRSGNVVAFYRHTYKRLVTVEVNAGLGVE